MWLWSKRRESNPHSILVFQGFSPSVLHFCFANKKARAKARAKMRGMLWSLRAYHFIKNTYKSRLFVRHFSYFSLLFHFFSIKIVSRKNRAFARFSLHYLLCSRKESIYILALKKARGNPGQKEDML